MLSSAALSPRQSLQEGRGSHSPDVQLQLDPSARALAQEQPQLRVPALGGLWGQSQPCPGGCCSPG